MSGSQISQAVDWTQAESLFCRALAIAGDAAGEFTLAAIWEEPEAGLDGTEYARHVEFRHPVNGPKALAEFRQMLTELAAIPGANLYVADALFKPFGEDRPRYRKGKAIEVIGVFATVDDFDKGHKPETRGERRPVVPHGEVETSPGNFQGWVFLDKLYPSAEAAPVFNALQRCVDADSTQSTEHLFRIPGTLNYPTQAKIDAGRSPEPYRANWVIEPEEWEPGITLDNLRDAILAKKPDAFTAKKKAASIDDDLRVQPDRPAHVPTVDEIEKSICLDCGAVAASKAKRSGKLKKLAAKLRHAWNLSLAEAIDFGIEHFHDPAPAGTVNIFSHYRNTADLETDFRRMWPLLKPQPDAVNPNEVFAAALGNIEAEDNSGGAEPRPLVYVRDRKAQLASPMPVMQVETILPDRKLVMPWGGTDAGKTYWASELTTAVAMDRPAFGRFKVLRPGPVLVFAGEDPEYFEQSRLTAIEKKYGRSLDGLVFTVADAIPIYDSDLAEKYFDEIRRVEKETGERFVLFLNETLKRSIGANNQKDHEIGAQFNKAMEDLIKEFGATMICTAHQPKSGADAGIAGSQTFMDNAPVTPHLIRIGKDPFEIRCEFEPKFRVGPKPQPFTVKGSPVALGKTIGGHSTDLVFMALSAAEERQARKRNAAWESDVMRVKRALWRLKAIGADQSRTTLMLATDIVSYAETGVWKTDSERLEKVGDLVKHLHNGARSTTRGGRVESGGQDHAPLWPWFERRFHQIGGRVQSDLCWFIPDEFGGQIEAEMEQAGEGDEL